MKTVLAISLLLPLSLFAKFVRTMQLDEPSRLAFIDDEVVYIVTTKMHKYNETRYDPKLGQFVDARSKRPIPFADNERIIKLDRLGGIGTGGSIAGYTSLEITQGTTAFAYPFDAEIGKAEVCASLISQAVDGDRIAYYSNETNLQFVASFSPKDNALRWLDPITFDVCEPLPPPDHDRLFCYSRMQQTNSTVTIVGGRIQKDIGVIKFCDHDIDEVFRIVENAGPEHQIDEKNLLHRAPERHSKSNRPSVLTPRKFYVVINDGRKAFGMFQPSIEKNNTLFSPITSAPLAIAKDDIAAFEPIGDGAFPTAECYSKNEVSDLYKKFMNPPASEKENAPQHPIRKILCAIVIACLGWLIPIVLQPISDSISKYLNAHPKIQTISIGVSLLAALLFLIFT